MLSKSKEFRKINAFLDFLADKYPFVNAVNIGKTHEGRDIKVIQVGTDGLAAGIFRKIHTFSPR